jgi:hypothetical protein
MPRMDVPAKGQGKRGQKKAWRDNARRPVEIYNLGQEELQATKTFEATEDVMSQALPFWDDNEASQTFWNNDDAPQSPKPIHIYGEEEVQELIDNAYREGWQDGMDEGYKLGKDGGYREYEEKHKV